MPAANPTVQRIGDKAKKVTFEEFVVSVETRQALEFVDVTPLLCEAVQRVGIKGGLVNVWTRHTTTGLLVNESEPLLLGDLAAMFERLAPAGICYMHDDFKRRTVNLTADERRNGHAHCRAALLRTSESVPVLEGRMALGRWQRVFLVEFDGGQRRELRLTLLGYS